MGRFQDPGCTIFVKNIEGRVTEEHLWELFLQAGPLRNVHIPLDRGTGKKRGFAFITYRDELSVDYACQLFNQIRLFKKPIYCNPSKDAKSSTSFNQSPSNRSGASEPSPSRSSNSSLIDGILQRSNSSSLPLTSTPYQGKRKYSQDPRSESGRVPLDKVDSRVIVLDNNSTDRDRGRYNSEHDDRDQRRYSEQEERDRNRYNSNDRERGRNDDSYRANDRSNREFFGSGGGYNRSENRDGSRDSERRYDDRSPGQGNRYERSNSSYGNVSPMHMQVLNQSHTQQNRENPSPRESSNFGPMRPDSQRNVRRQRNQPY